MITAMQWIKPMSAGSSKPQLILDTNLNEWVIKSTNSTQGVQPNQNQMFNELFACRLAENLGISVMPGEVVYVSDEFLNAYPQLRQATHGAFSTGHHFASKFIQGVSLKQVESSGETYLLRDTINGWDASKYVAFDTWTYNHDHAHAIYGAYIPNPDNLLFIPMANGFFEMRLIDFGLAFVGAWHDDPAQINPFHLDHWHSEVLGVYTIFCDFGWLRLESCHELAESMENFPYARLEVLALSVPPEWRSHISLTLLQKFLFLLVNRSGRLKGIFDNSFNNGYIARRLAIPSP